ncbi:MAG: DNA helicase RecQ [Isosphaeraceae bacterium]
MAENVPVPTEPPGLDALLKRHFGFRSFRPHQREIVESLLAGQDVLALLPTGGGKSLCYQLPAIAVDGLTVVVSPLIALMKDQVDSLDEIGVPATFLNSSLPPDEYGRRWRDLGRRGYKILYLAPERLVTEEMLGALRAWNVGLIAVDEAHCISEWGHDFRREYRELAVLRQQFPHVPLIGLTATATARVRDDIVSMLRMREPRIHVASFNRPNLSYRIVPRVSPLKQVLAILAEHRGESGIIYCMTRKRTEELAESLADAGIAASAYHAGLDATERARRQDLFIKDQVQVIVATVAFGMGIHKPDVRFVVHHDLPKNIESYYQETGRAGRDGLPGECVLLYAPSDAVRLHRLIDTMEDEHEQMVARKHLTQLIEFCESALCRRVQLLQYFGETYRGSDGEALVACGACDNCLTPRDRIDGTLPAQKFLSCVLRIEQKSGFKVGLHHVVDVLCGAETEKVRKWGHERLSTYGIGKEHSRYEWAHFAREFIRLGLLLQNTAQFNVLEVTPGGRDFLKNRARVEVNKPLETARLSREKRDQQKKMTGAMSYDTDLYARLRDWRKKIAAERGVPAYVIFHDSTLQAITHERPTSMSALSRIAGLGDRKLATYGEQILAVIRASA